MAGSSHLDAWAELANDRIVEAVATLVPNECCIIATDALARIGVGAGETSFPLEGLLLRRERSGRPLTGRSTARETVVHERVVLAARSHCTLMALCRAAMAYEKRDLADER